jgi:glyoxylase-like metal-dependent hydrolase (beta-lactamase superfamily II)
MALSRRDFMTRSALVLGAGTLAPQAIARAMQQAQQTPPPAAAAPQAPSWQPVFTPMRRNIGYYTGRGGTIGYLINKGGVVVVDSQYPDSAKACLDGLNERSQNRGVDLLINTHHHGDHTGGNIVFKGVAKKVLAHERAVALQKEVAAAAAAKLPAGTAAPEQLYADRTTTHVWREEIGDEWVRSQHYGPAHTGGDLAITFERANVVHMGDLMFNRRHPFVDRPAGATIKGHIAALEAVVKDHAADTQYIFGHSGPQPAPATGPFPLTGSRVELLYFRDYLTALLAYVQSEIKAGRSREVITAVSTPLKGFETHGNLTAAILGAAYDELTTK